MKVIFIINSCQNQRCIKRVNEFVENGYNIEAYAFDRGESLYNKPNFNLKIIAKFSNNLSYRKRIGIILRNINKVVANHKSEDVVFYLFGLDIAMLFSFVTNKRYIYEESDLAHTYINNKFIKFILDRIDKFIIRKSLLTVFTSEGFKIYHFGDRRCPNIHLIPNKLHPNILKYKIHNSDPSLKRLKIGFVGFIRYESVLFFAKTFVSNFPNYEFHFYGDIEDAFKERFSDLKQYSNIYFHGRFKTPDDLSNIYSNIDLLLSTYDVKYENVRYAEPNKLYEAIYFEKPIIVSKSTYLAEKVNNLKIGYAVNPLDEKEIVDFITNLTLNDINEKSRNAQLIDKKECINLNTLFFSKIASLITK